MLQRLFLSERIMLGVIMFNAVIIFLLAFPHLEMNATLIAIDHFFILFFSVEALVKIKAVGWRAYTKNGWNRFDAIIVLLSLPELINDFAHIFGSAGQAIMLFRLFRLVRLMRFIRFVPNMRHILAGLGRAFKASVFVLVALLFLNFLFAVFTTYIYGRELPQYFGDPLTSAFTIFQMFTLEGWSEVPAALADSNVSPLTVWFARFYFAFVVLSGGIFGMSLANAVFVDEMTIDNNRDLETKIDELHQKINALTRLIEEKHS